MFAVEPKYDCPHELLLDHSAILNFLVANFSNDSKKIYRYPCSLCENLCDGENENWLCLTCLESYCSRYVRGHMQQHNEEMNTVFVTSDGHQVALSFSDGSFWCYACDSYVFSPRLKSISKAFGQLKHPSLDTSNPPAIQEQNENFENNDIGDNAKAKAQDYATEEPTILNTKFTFEELIEGLQTKRYRSVCFLTGAGISVAAGIPDFRSPGIGLYDKIRALGIPSLSSPESVFSLDVLNKQPELFYSLAKDLVTSTPQPVGAHYFIKRFADEGLLKMVFTQNIDSLELAAGLSPDYLVQAHGHMRLAHCTSCSREYPVAEVTAAMERAEVLWCADCGSVVKPDIVFFGEQLPKRFGERFFDIQDADLVIVMGTSLKVFPFASLLELVPSVVPIVLINRESNSDLELKRKFLFLGGDIEDNVREISAKLGWDLKMDCNSSKS